MANPLHDLIDLLDKSDDFIMALEKEVDSEGLKILKEADGHLNEAYKSLKKLKNRMTVSSVIKRCAKNIKNSS